MQLEQQQERQKQKERIEQERRQTREGFRQLLPPAPKQTSYGAITVKVRMPNGSMAKRSSDCHNVLQVICYLRCWIAELKKKKQHRVSKIQTIKISSILFKRISDQISPDIFISCLFSVSLRTVVLNGRDT
jgi:hypothetical protein